jgi:DNA-binding transcriptional MerR regulator
MAIRNYNTNKTEENIEMVKFLLDLNLTNADIDIFNNNHESPRTLNAELIHNIVAEQNAVKHDEAVRAYSESQRLKNLKMEEDYAF